MKRKFLFGGAYLDKLLTTFIFFIVQRKNKR